MHLPILQLKKQRLREAKHPAEITQLVGGRTKGGPLYLSTRLLGSCWGMNECTHARMHARTHACTQLMSSQGTCYVPYSGSSFPL